MNEASDQGPDRREFFRGVLRKAALGAIGLRGGVIARRAVRQGAHTCINRGICRGCGAFAGCILPHALSAKQAAQMKKAPPDGTRQDDTRKQ